MALNASGLLTGLALASALTVSGVAQASDLPSRKGAPPVPVPPSITWIDVAVSVKGLTDYNFRGISQNDRKPAIQGSAELQIYDTCSISASSPRMSTSPPARRPKSTSMAASARNSGRSPSISA